MEKNTEQKRIEYHIINTKKESSPHGCAECAFRPVNGGVGCELSAWECECLNISKNAHYEKRALYAARESLHPALATVEEAVRGIEKLRESKAADKQKELHDTTIHIKKAELPERLRNKYVKVLWGYDPITKSNIPVLADYYDVAEAFHITDPALDHCTKKLVQPGARGCKTRLQDLVEAKQSLERAIENEVAKQSIPWVLDD